MKSVPASLRAALLVATAAALPAAAQTPPPEADTRQFAPLPAAAQATLRVEMLDNLAALNEIISLMAEGKLKDAGAVAEQRLGVSAMGRHRGKPLDARPGPHMPEAMHGIGMEGHRTASEFARLAAAGERDKALAALSGVTGTCMACHYAYRVR